MPTVHIDKSREAISRKTAIIVIAFMNNGIMFMTTNDVIEEVSELFSEQSTTGRSTLCP